MEGRSCPLARRGHSRDGKRGKLQIEFGLLCNRNGCPVSVEVFPGNTADPATLASQIATVRERFSPAKVVLVGDRGMLTEARIREEVKPAGLDWISALRSSAIRALVEAGEVEMSLFDERDLVEITSDAYPGERLMVCRNPLLAADRARKRSELLAATEALLEPVAAATRREKRRLKGKERIGERVGKVIGTYRMAKHFTWSIDDEGVFTWQRDDASIAAEARLDGLYVIRTSLPQTEVDGPGTVGAGLQAARIGGTGLPQPEDRGPQGPPCLPSHRTPGSCPRPAVHARLPRGVEHAPEAQTHAVRRRGCRWRRGPAPVRRRSGEGIDERPGKGGDQKNSRR